MFFSQMLIIQRMLESLNQGLNLLQKQRENVGSESMINEAREYQEDAQGNRYYKGIDY